MPELSRFLGIVIGMFYREHGVPHFHAVYGEHEISVEIETATFHGDFPPRARIDPSIRFGSPSEELASPREILRV